MPSIPQAFLKLSDCISFWSQGLSLSEGLFSMASSIAWTLASTRRSWSSSGTSRQSEIALDFSDWTNLRPKGPWIVVCAFGPFLFIRHFTIGHITWGVTSQLFTFLTKFSIASVRVTLRIVFVIQLTAFYKVYPWFHATTSAASACAAGEDLGPAAHCLVLKVWVYVSTGYTPRQ